MRSWILNYIAFTLTILMYNALGEHDIRRQVIQYNCIYRILTLYRMTIYINCLQHLSFPLDIYISTHANIPRVSTPSELRQTQFTNYRAVPFCMNFRTCITSVSICSYVPASEALSFMFYVNGMLRATARVQQRHPE